MKKTSKRQIVLSELKKGRRLSPLDAWKCAKTLCMAEIIRDLKRLGYVFDTKYVVENGCRFATYKLIGKPKKEGK